MEAYKASIAKLTPEKLDNTLLTLNEEFKNIIPEDKALADAVRAKIEVVKEQISGLRRDRSPSVRVDTGGGIGQQMLENWNEVDLVI